MIGVASNKGVDSHVRERIRAWLIHYMARRQWTQEQLAAEIGIAASTLNQIVRGTRTAGFDVAIRMHRKLLMSLDDLIDTDPPVGRR